MKDRGNQRVLHGVMQFISAVLMMCGYLVMFVHKENSDSSQIARGESNLKQAHVWIGYITLVGILMQVVVGLFKFVLKARQPRNKWAQWHGLTGVLTYMLGIISVILAVSFVWVSKKESKGVGAGVIVLLVLLMIVTIADLVLGPKQETNTQAGQADRRSAGRPHGALLGPDGHLGGGQIN